MEEEGVTIDTDALAEMGAEIGYKLAAIEGEIYQMAGRSSILTPPNSCLPSSLKSSSR